MLDFTSDDAPALAADEGRRAGTTGPGGGGFPAPLSRFLSLTKQLRVQIVPKRDDDAEAGARRWSAAPASRTGMEESP